MAQPTRPLTQSEVQQLIDLLVDAQSRLRQADSPSPTRVPGNYAAQAGKIQSTLDDLDIK